MTAKKPIILVFVGYYLPGFRSGGPVRSIVNFVDHFGHEFDIRIVTRVRDAFVMQPYPDVKVDEWNQVGAARVFYASEMSLTLPGVVKLIRETQHDLLYLNSFFDIKFTLLPLIARRLKVVHPTKCIIAPRGEFSKGAISLKTLRKRIYIRGVKLFRLTSGLRWQASSDLEARDIQREFNIPPMEICVAQDLPPPLKLATSPSRVREMGLLRIVFISRISPMKNLDYLLRVLKSVASEVELCIYGPRQEPEYWTVCDKLVAALPSHVSAEYFDEVEPKDVLSTFSRFDLFVFPTRGENYGHVILESLMAGTPVLVSDQTPWRGTNCGAIEMLPLERETEWASAIDRWSSYPDIVLEARRRAALKYAENYLRCDTVIKRNRALFLSVRSS